VEIMKTLHGFDDPVVNEEIGSIDYMDEEEKKMLRVLLEGEKQTKYAHMVKQTVEEAETTDIDEIFIVANKLTQTAREFLTSNDSVSYISPKIWQPFSVTELKYVIETKLKQLETQVDKDSELYNHIETVKRNTGFHASMKWHDLLMEDLSTLVSIEEEFQPEEAH